MRVGVYVDTRGAADPVAAAIAGTERAARDGLDSAWFQHSLGADSLTLAAHAVRAASIEVGVGVFPAPTRHPLAVAQTVDTLAAGMTASRFTLGLGASHRSSLREIYGLALDDPVGDMERFLDALQHGRFPVPPGVDVVLGALGPRMLRLAGSRTSGTVTWLAGAAALRDHVVPALPPGARVAAAVAVHLTDDVDDARAWVEERFAFTAGLPSYAGILRRGGATPQEVAIVGDEREMRDRLDELAAIGVTDLLVLERTAPAPDVRTRDALVSWRDGGE